MKTHLPFFLLLLTSVVRCHTSPSIQTGKAINLPHFSNSVMATNILTVAHNVRSSLRCMMLCLEIQACVSVYHRQVYRRCQFHDILFLSPQDGEQELGTEYYSLTTGSCPSAYIHSRHLGLCYQLHLNGGQHRACLSDCASRGEHFIVIDTQKKQDQVRRQLLSSSDLAGRSYYIDGSDAAAESQWVFHDGRKLTYFAFAPGYPVNRSDHDYLVADKRKDYQWNDVTETSNKYYMCEKDIGP